MKIEKLPNVHALVIIFAFEYKVHKYGIITHQISLRTQNKKQKIIKEKRSKALGIKDMVEHKEKIPNEECNIRLNQTLESTCSPRQA